MSRLDTAECSGGASTALSPAIMYSNSRAATNSSGGSQQQEMWSTSSIANSQSGSNSNLNQSSQSPNMRPTSPVNKSFRMQYPQESSPTNNSSNVMVDSSNANNVSVAVSTSMDSSSSIDRCDSSRSVMPGSPQDPSSNVFSQPLYVRWMYTAVSAPVFHPSTTHFSQHEGYLHHQGRAWQHEQQQSPTDKTSCVESSPPVALSDMTFPVQSSPAILPSFRSQSFSFADTRHPQQQYMQRKSIGQINQDDGGIPVMQAHKQQKQIQHPIPHQMVQHYHHQPQKCSPTGNSQENHVPGSPCSKQGSHTPHISFSSPLHHSEPLRSTSPQDQVLRSLNASPQSKSSSRRSAAHGSNTGSPAPRSFSCYVDGCKKSYSTGAGLRYHLKSFHDTITPRAASIKAKSRTFCCPECPLKAFSTAAGLRYHCKTVHS